MSVSLIALRLEIASDYPLLPHLCFLATRNKRIMASEINKNKPGDSEESNLNTEESGHKYSMEKCRGSRVLQEMTIETITNSKSSTSEEVVTDASNAKTTTEKSNAKTTTDTSNAKTTTDASNAKTTTDTSTAKKPNSSSAKSSKGKMNEKKSCVNLPKKVSKNETGQREKQKLKNTGGIVNNEKNASSKVNETSISSEEPAIVLPVEVVTEDVALKDNSNMQEFSNSDPEKRNRLLHPGPINFSSGNHFVEVTKGLLHLYKEK